MKRLNFTIMIVLITGLFIISCSDGSEETAEVLQEIEEETAEEIQETEEEPENFIPIIEISPESQTVENGASLTFSVDIDDQDDFYHFYLWTVDGVDSGTEDSMTFSASPETEKTFVVSVAVSDGTDLVSASSLITVKEPPWTPEPLNIYFFEIGTEPDDGLWVKRYTASDSDEYDYFAIASVTNLEMYNRDHEPDAYRVMGGYP